MFFGVWAPNAESVHVIGTFNGWDETAHPMEKLGPGGIHATFIPGVGTGELYKYLINKLHKNKIGVILDWVPAHFATDAHGLGRFDGQCIFEDPDPRKGEHPDWGTKIFNYGKTEVKNFLIANALFWIKEFHIDGIRVDAVASMLYLDYGKKDGQWVANKYGDNKNLEAIEFFKHLKCSMVNKMPGYHVDKYANLRAGYTYMFGHAGKKLLFMGQDFGQEREWSEERELDWFLLGEELNSGLHSYVKELLSLYRKYPCMYEFDNSWDGFEWLNCDDKEVSAVKEPCNYRDYSITIDLPPYAAVFVF